LKLFLKSKEVIKEVESVDREEVLKDDEVVVEVEIFIVKM